MGLGRWVLATVFFGDAKLHFVISLAHSIKTRVSPPDGVAGTLTRKSPPFPRGRVAGWGLETLQNGTFLHAPKSRETSHYS